MCWPTPASPPIPDEITLEIETPVHDRCGGRLQHGRDGKQGPEYLQHQVCAGQPQHRHRYRTKSRWRSRHRFMIVAVGDFNMGAMENKGLNIFNTKYVLANPSIATDTGRNHAGDRDTGS